jgi:hypothetical protein
MLSDNSTVYTIFAAMQRHSTGRSWPWVPLVQWPTVSVASQPAWQCKGDIGTCTLGHALGHAWHPAVQKMLLAGFLGAGISQACTNHHITCVRQHKMQTFQA